MIENTRHQTVITTSYIIDIDKMVSDEEFYYEIDKTPANCVVFNEVEFKGIIDKNKSPPLIERDECPNRNGAI